MCHSEDVGRGIWGFEIIRDSSHSFGMAGLGILQKKFGYSEQLRRKIKENKEVYTAGFVYGE